MLTFAVIAYICFIVQAFVSAATIVRGRAMLQMMQYFVFLCIATPPPFLTIHFVNEKQYGFSIVSATIGVLYNLILSCAMKIVVSKNGKTLEGD